MFSGALYRLISSAERGDYYSHIPLIPLVTVYLIYTERKRIFGSVEYSYAAGGILVLAGILVRLLAETRVLAFNQNDYTSVAVFGGLLFLTGGFVLSFGTRSVRQALFPLLFLLFMVPVPSLLMDGFIYLLQVGSTEVSYYFFMLAGVPIFREGFVFNLPGLSVEVAKQCSGIRSSLALVITVVLASHLFLRSGWRKAVLILAIFPITIIKNGIRILTITLLALHVDIKFLTHGWLHQSGGFVFFIPALALLGTILWGLRRMER
jgi:exosortase